MFRPLLFTAAASFTEARVCLSTSPRPAISDRVRLRPASQTDTRVVPSLARMVPPRPFWRAATPAQRRRFGRCRRPSRLGKFNRPLHNRLVPRGLRVRPARPVRDSCRDPDRRRRFVTPARPATPACLPLSTSGTSPLEASGRKLGAVFVQRKRGKGFPRAVHICGRGSVGNGRAKSFCYPRGALRTMVPSPTVMARECGPSR